MFESDSESQRQFNLQKVAEEEQPHVRQILQKAKKILPSYDDEALYGLFKRYYSVENIFFNELNIIARRSKGEFDDDHKKKDDKWIKIGREVKTKVNKSKYNFLQDKQLLRRAEQYVKYKKLVPERRQFSGPNQRRPQNQRPRNDQSQNGQTNNNRSYQQRKPKQKYMEKVEDNKPVTETAQQVQQEQKPAATKVESSQVKEAKYKEKVETVQPAVQQTQAKQEEKRPEKPVKKTETKPQEAPKKEEKPVTKPETTKKEEPAKKPEPVTQQKPVEPKVEPVEAQKPVSQPAKQQPIQSSHSIPTVQNFDPVLAAKNFEQACNQNSFVLKFIQPQAYPQRISYVRTADGGMKNVQIRVTGTSNQGSSKAL